MNTLAPSVTERLSPEQLRALIALIETGDKAKAARSAGVSRTTLYRWMREDPVFQAALEDATRQALKEFSASLVRLAQKAVKALESALDSKEAAHLPQRLRAADIVTTKLLAVRELVDIEARLTELEAKSEEHN